jgi:hypothetical protein
MSIFKKVIDWVEGIFSKAGKELEDVIIPAAIAVTNALKTITDLDTADIIGSIAGKAGAAAEEKVKQLLPGVIVELQLAQQFKGLDPNTTLANILKLVGTSAPITQTAFWIEFSGMLATDMQDDKLDLGESASLLKYWYDNHPAVPVAAPAPDQAAAN